VKSKFSGEEAFRFLESLAFERFAGTEAHEDLSDRFILQLPEERGQIHFCR